MSNIPMAREILADALRDLNRGLPEMRKAMRKALRLMVREAPEFKVPAELAPLTQSQRQIAREMRLRGCSLNHIAQSIGTNIGRVSEAINE